MTRNTRIPTTGALYAGSLVRGALLAASDLLSRIHRWASDATGLRAIPAHKTQSPPAQPSPVALEPVFVTLRRIDGQMKTVEVQIPANTPAKLVMFEASMKIWELPEALAFGMKWTIEQAAFRPDCNKHLLTPVDTLINQHNNRRRLDVNCD